MKRKVRRFLRFIFKNRVPMLGIYALVITIVAVSLFSHEIRTEKNETTETSESVVTELSTEPEWVYFEASAYCSCRKCCGKWADNRPTDKYGNEIVYGAASIPLEEGVSIAADWDILPKGTVVEIEGYGVYTVEDTGADIKGYKIDIFFDSHVIAEAFGRKTVAIRILEVGGGLSENKG